MYCGSSTSRSNGRRRSPRPDVLVVDDEFLGVQQRPEQALSAGWSATRPRRSSLGSGPSRPAVGSRLSVRRYAWRTTCRHRRSPGRPGGVVLPFVARAWRPSPARRIRSSISLGSAARCRSCGTCSRRALHLAPRLLALAAAASRRVAGLRFGDLRDPGAAVLLDRLRCTALSFCR